MPRGVVRAGEICYSDNKSRAPVQSPPRGLHAPLESGERLARLPTVATIPARNTEAAIPYEDIHDVPVQHTLKTFHVGECKRTSVEHH